MSTDSYHDDGEVEKLRRWLDQKGNEITQSAAKG
jgi:hypothetical protein